MTREAYIRKFRDAWGDIFSEEKNSAGNEIYFTLRSDALSRFPKVCAALVKVHHARFVTIIANDERSISGKFFIYYVFSVPAIDVFLILKVPVDDRHRELPSISNLLDAPEWFEREMKDWFGIIPFPNIARLAVHPDWPEDVYPMLKNFNPKETVPRLKGSLDFKPVEGEGVFEIPVGPVHAGIIEPGHFRFSVAGEPIINLDAQLYYVHKGTEKIAEGMAASRAVFLAERISGDSSFAHALAYCHAIERLAGIEIPQRALVIRTVLLELERLYNHLGDIGAILLDVGFSVGASLAFQLKERFMQLNEILTGSRLLRGIAAIGGVRRDIEDTQAKLEAQIETLRNAPEAFEKLVDLALSSSTVLDRLETTGILAHENAERLGVVGIAARASGIDRDFRKDHPHCVYPHLQFKTALHEEGDVFARMNVRVNEVRESFRIIEQLRRQHIHEPMIASYNSLPSHAAALGYVEGWRGEIVHWLMTDENGNIFRWKITDPSSHNWRGVLLAVRNNIVPDFPVINKSFNLSYSGNDR
jgi:Ni,Fe-hydrogenase III large subunit/Ni,Fe-hydrogenase III component G